MKRHRWSGETCTKCGLRADRSLKRSLPGCVPDSRVGQPLFSPEDSDLADRAMFLAHRLVMAKALGRTLGREEIVDHINGNRIDCRRENLRITDFVGSNQNKRVCNPSGFRGVTKSTNKGSTRWWARVTHKGKRVFVGSFDTPEAADRAAREARKLAGFLDGNGS